MRILHIAPANIAGVPLCFVQAERQLGHESRLITLMPNAQNRQEDICLHLPFIHFWGTRFVKSLFVSKKRRSIHYIADVPKTIPRYWHPESWIETKMIQFREVIWKRKIQNAWIQHHIEDFDVYQLDGGLGFYRDGRLMRQMKEKGKKIICCYTGSDLRVRGVISEIDHISDLNVTVEFDHLQFHPDIHHVMFPINISQFNVKEKVTGDKIRIGHAPTSRKAKGSDIIISHIRTLEKELPVQLILIEGLVYSEAITLKQSCDLFIDQIGNLGYGMNSIEALAMGIPTCTSLAPRFEERYPDHPFIVIDSHNICEKITALIQHPEQLNQIGMRGREWVKRYHNSVKVVQKIHRLAGL
ncbi:glycosyltransferase family 1 protein [bacterium]|nr:glycosyltransferase family 1 protein [bacterium]